jgi:mono/diheme cytochrome c family protein
MKCLAACLEHNPIRAGRHRAHVAATLHHARARDATPCFAIGGAARYGPVGVPPMRRWVVLLRHALLLWPAGALAADLPGDPQAGEGFARDVCGACHFVAKDAPDPGIGPSFYEVAEYSGTTEMSLRVFLQTPHATMPNLMLDPDETDDVISYILTLKGR